MAREFTMRVECDNDAFSPDAGPELVRILRVVTHMVDQGFLWGPLHDINGNAVGEWSAPRTLVGEVLDDQETGQVPTEQ